MARTARASASPLKGARKPKAARVTKGAADLVNLKYMGPEPVAPRLAATKIEIIRAFNWYNICKEKEDAINYLTTFYVENKKVIAKINNAGYLNKTAGWIARMISRGWILPDTDITYMHNYIAELPAPIKQTRVVVDAEAKPKNRLDEFIPDFEDAIDAWPAAFSAYSYLVSNNVPQVYAKGIFDHYEPLFKEVTEALRTRDDDLKASYKWLPLSKLKLYAKFIEEIMSDITRYLNNAKKERAPRKKKTLSAEQILKHFNYLKSHDAMKLVSIDPIKINGASVVYTFNTAYNTFTIYVAEKNKTLQINRSTIEGFDPKTSRAKRVGRKYQEAIDKSIAANKANRTKFLDSFTNEYIENISGRVNNNTIILGAFK